MSKLAHLRIYRFDPGAVFEGGLLAALERMQLGEDWKLLDVLFVTRDATSGEFEAVDLGTGGADATLASLLDFRLDPGRRRALTERTLAEHRGGVPRPLIEAIVDEKIAELIAAAERAAEIDDPWDALVDLLEAIAALQVQGVIDTRPGSGSSAGAGPGHRNFLL